MPIDTMKPVKFYDDRSKDLNELRLTKILFENADICLCEAYYDDTYPNEVILFRKDTGSVLTENYLYWYAENGQAAKPSELGEPVEEFAQRLSDAYSTGRYENGWRPCIKMLRKKNFSDKEIEAIIRSKYTRWAANSSTRPYGRASSKDLERYLEKNLLQSELEMLVRESFKFDDRGQG